MSAEMMDLLRQAMEDGRSHPDLRWDAHREDHPAQRPV